MKFRVILAPRAINDFRNLYDYLLSQTDEEVATNYVAELYKYCLSFETFPHRGARRDDLHPGLRIVGYRRRASIAFQVTDGLVTIVRVFQRGQDIVLSEDD